MEREEGEESKSGNEMMHMEQEENLSSDDET